MGRRITNPAIAIGEIWLSSALLVAVDWSQVGEAPRLGVGEKSGGSRMQHCAHVPEPVAEKWLN